MAAKATDSDKSQGAEKSMDEAKKAVLNKALDDITKRYGEGAIIRLGEARHLEVAAIPTGSLSLDIALGVGGMPRARVAEIFGPEASGKTTLCLHLAAEAQKMGGTVAFIDMEHALDPAYAAKVGVNVDESAHFTAGYRRAGAWRSCKPWCVPALWTWSWLTVLPLWCPVPRSKGIWAMPPWACRRA